MTATSLYLVKWPQSRIGWYFFLNTDHTIVLSSVKFELYVEYNHQISLAALAPNSKLFSNSSASEPDFWSIFVNTLTSTCVKIQWSFIGVNHKSFFKFKLLHPLDDAFWKHLVLVYTPFSIVKWSSSLGSHWQLWFLQSLMSNYFQHLKIIILNNLN